MSTVQKSALQSLRMGTVQIWTLLSLLLMPLIGLVLYWYSYMFLLCVSCRLLAHITYLEYELKSWPLKNYTKLCYSRCYVGECTWISLCMWWNFTRRFDRFRPLHEKDLLCLSAWAKAFVWTFFSLLCHTGLRRCPYQCHWTDAICSAPLHLFRETWSVTRDTTETDSRHSAFVCFSDISRHGFFFLINPIKILGIESQTPAESTQKHIKSIYKLWNMWCLEL